MTKRETLVRTLTNALAVTRVGRMDAHRAEAERLVDEALKEHAHELAERIRSVPDADSGIGNDWDWWDAATIPDMCADLIDPEATPEPATPDQSGLRAVAEELDEWSRLAEGKS